MPRILVVDDDHNLRRALGTALGRNGYEVEQAGNGADMLRRIKTLEPWADRVVLEITERSDVLSMAGWQSTIESLALCACNQHPARCRGH